MWLVSAGRNPHACFHSEMRLLQNKDGCGEGKTDQTRWAQGHRMGRSVGLYIVWIYDHT